MNNHNIELWLFLIAFWKWLYEQSFGVFKQDFSDFLFSLEYALNISF